MTKIVRNVASLLKFNTFFVKLMLLRLNINTVLLISQLLPTSIIYNV